MSSPSIYNSLIEDTAAAAESLLAMMQKEKTIYKTCDYLNPPLPLPESEDGSEDSTLITECDRLKIVDWCYSISDHYNLDRECVAIAMEMVDRFLSKPSHFSYDVLTERNKFQLLAMAALNIAIKTTQKIVVGCDFLAASSLGMYSVEDIEVMEMNILEGLSWRVCAPTSIQMAHYIVSLLLPHVDLPELTWGWILDEVRYQTEHAVRDYYLSTKRPSTLAVAAIFNSLEQIDQQDRQAILGALTLVLNVLEEDFDSPRDLLSARNKLLSLVEGHDATQDDTIVIEPIVIESSREVNVVLDLQVLDIEHQPAGYIVEKKSSTTSPRTSPGCVSLSCQENSLEECDPSLFEGFDNHACQFGLGCSGRISVFD